GLFSKHARGRAAAGRRGAKPRVTRVGRRCEATHAAKRPRTSEAEPDREGQVGPRVLRWRMGSARPAKLERSVVTLHPPDLLVKLCVRFWIAVVVLTFFGADRGFTAWAPAVVAFLVGWLYITWMVRRRLVIGCDGVVIRGVEFHRFVSYGRIEHVETHERGVTLRLRAGDAVHICVVPGFFRARRARVKALARRLEAEREAWRNGGARPATAALLERNGLPIRAWRQRVVDAVTEAISGYRTQSLSREDAACIVEDPGAALELRIGAALALSPSTDPGVRR